MNKVLDINKDGKLFYERSLEFLKLKAISFKENDNLDDYFDPFSESHVIALKTDFENEKLNPVSNYEQYCFARFVKSWFNGSYKNAINISKHGKEINLLLEDFKVDKDNNLNGLCLFNKVIKNEGNQFENLNKINPKYRILEFCEGVSSIHNIIKDKHYLERLSSEIYDMRFEDYIAVVQSKINQEITKDLVGMGLTLLSDAIKESNIIDVVKPDLHIIRVLNAVFELKLKESPSNDKEYEKVVSAMWKIYQQVKAETYKNKKLNLYIIDKIIYLSCASFYLDAEKANNSSKNRKALIAHITKK